MIGVLLAVIGVLILVKYGNSKKNNSENQGPYTGPDSVQVNPDLVEEDEPQVVNGIGIPADIPKAFWSYAILYYQRIGKYPVDYHNLRKWMEMNDLGEELLRSTNENDKGQVEPV